MSDSGGGLSIPVAERSAGAGCAGAGAAADLAAAGRTRVARRFGTTARLGVGSCFDTADRFGWVGRRRRDDGLVAFLSDCARFGTFDFGLDVDFGLDSDLDFGLGVDFGFDSLGFCSGALVRVFSRPAAFSVRAGLDA